MAFSSSWGDGEPSLALVVGFGSKLPPLGRSGVPTGDRTSSSTYARLALSSRPEWAWDWSIVTTIRAAPAGAGQDARNRPYGVAPYPDLVSRTVSAEQQPRHRKASRQPSFRAGFRCCH